MGSSSLPRLTNTTSTLRLEVCLQHTLRSRSRNPCRLSLRHSGPRIVNRVSLRAKTSPVMAPTTCSREVRRWVCRHAAHTHEMAAAGDIQACAVKQQGTAARPSCRTSLHWWGSMLPNCRNLMIFVGWARPLTTLHGPLLDLLIPARCLSCVTSIVLVWLRHPGKIVGSPQLEAACNVARERWVLSGLRSRYLFSKPPGSLITVRVYEPCPQL
jgi:hypothetical protein